LSAFSSYEILETLKIDYENGICIDIIEFHVKPGIDIRTIEKIGNMEISSILASDGDKHTCLIKYIEPKETMDLFRESDLDLIHSTPTIISPEKLTVSVIGENDKLIRFIEMIKLHLGEAERITFKKAAYQKQELLTILTKRQREVILEAYLSGYYDYPKKITSDELSKKVDLSKPTLIQHLRKAEGRLLTEIMTGYTV
jgi:predicted DNA binding protein